MIGGKLGVVFARAGHDVVFSYSRSRPKLEQLQPLARTIRETCNERATPLSGQIMWSTQVKENKSENGAEGGT